MKWLRGINSNLVLVALLIIVASQVFFYAPFRQLLELREAYSLVCFLIAAVGVFYWREKRFPYYLPLTIMMSLLIVWPAITAMFSYGQPISYGLASGRIFLGFQSFIVLYFLLDRGVINLDLIRRSMMFLIWASLLSYLATNFIIRPEEIYHRFPEYRTLVKIDPLRSRFGFPQFFVILGTLYYYVKYLREERFTVFALSFVFYSYIVVFDQTRQVILGLGIVMVLLLWKGGFKLKRAAPVLGLLAVEILISLDIFLALFAANETSRLARKEEVAAVVSSLPESKSALEYISSIVFGAGRVSYQWHGGYGGVLGKYFYPIDIGLFGIFFIYGVFGLAIFLLFYFFIFREARRLAFKDADCMFLALKYYVFYSVVIGVFRFKMPYYPGLFASILAIIAFYNRNPENQGSAFQGPTGTQA